MQLKAQGGKLTTNVTDEVYDIRLLIAAHADARHALQLWLGNVDSSRLTVVWGCGRSKHIRLDKTSGTLYNLKFLYYQGDDLLQYYYITITVTLAQLSSRILGCRLLLNRPEAYYLPFECAHSYSLNLQIA